MMQFCFCDLAVVSVRSEPSDKAEMTTQLLFGDVFEVIGQVGSWFHIKIYFDGYQGWVDAKQIHEIGEEEFHRLISSPVSVNRQLYSDSVFHNGQAIKLTAGCSFYSMNDDHVMKIDGQEYILKGKAYPYKFTGFNSLLKTAHNYLYCPYLWGGKTYLGMDCSGLTQVVYKQHGIGLLRDAVQQATQGEIINFINDSLPGDLAFFDNADGKISHVGILLNKNKILHCSGKVRIDDIDHQGIFNRDLIKYTHSLRLIRRVSVVSL